MRREKFTNGQYYHVYNRGVEKRDIFLDKYDYFRFIKSLKIFNQIEPIRNSGYLGNKTVGPLEDENLINVIAYCLNPNHFHFILQQIEEGGVSEFMKRIGVGYTGYFNKKYERSGVLFQGKFKSIHIDSNEYLLYLSAYVNNNYFIHGYGEEKWEYSSLRDYLGERNGSLCKKDIILNQFNGKGEYKDFLEGNSVYLKEKKEVQRYIIE